MSLVAPFIVGAQHAFMLYDMMEPIADTPASSSAGSEAGGSPAAETAGDMGTAPSCSRKSVLSSPLYNNDVFRIK